MKPRTLRKANLIIIPVKNHGEKKRKEVLVLELGGKPKELFKGKLARRPNFPTEKRNTLTLSITTNL